jgi:hypothetical protein
LPGSATCELSLRRTTLQPTKRNGQTILDRIRLALKVEWEGGVLAALEYGIRATDIEDAEIRVAWETVERAYRALTPLVDRLRILLELSSSA